MGRGSYDHWLSRWEKGLDSPPRVLTSIQPSDNDTRSNISYPDAGHLTRWDQELGGDLTLVREPALLF